MNGVASVEINHPLVECTKCMHCDGNRPGYGAVLLIMVGHILTSSSNLDAPGVTTMDDILFCF